MVEPVIISIALSYFSAHAHDWLQALKETALGKVKDQAKQRVSDFLNEKQQLRHMELALKTAAERTIVSFQSRQERDQCKDVLTALAKPGQHDTFRREALRLFNFSETPDLTELNEIYHHSLPTSHPYMDAGPYLKRFFETLLTTLYQDPFFRNQMSETLQNRAALSIQRSLPDILVVLRQISDAFSDDYTTEQFEKDFAIYASHIERSLRFLKITGVVSGNIGSEYKDPELAGMFVPLRVAPRRATEQAHSDENNLLNMLQTTSYMVLLGGPGTGKSTITRYLAWSHAHKHVSYNAEMSTDLLTGYPIPLRIELRFLADIRRRLHPECDFIGYVTNVLLPSENVHIDRRLFERLLERQGMLVLFDGLDEVATLQERQKLTEDIENFVQDYPGNRVIVTSRPLGYDVAPCSDQWFTHAQVLPLNDEQIHDFLERWYVCVLRHYPIPPTDRAELEELAAILKERPGLHTLAETPLLLSVITPLHRYQRLPDRRVMIYEQCAELLLDRWAKLKGTDKRWQDMKLARNDQHACVAHLGFTLHRNSQEAERELTQNSDVPLQMLSRELNNYFKDQGLSASLSEQHQQVEQLLELIRVETGLIVERGTDEKGATLYGFVHRTFQEYFAAANVYERYQEEMNDTSILSKFLIEYLHDPHWQEVILLLFGKLKRKPASAQLKDILEGKIRSRRSKYTEFVQQDLFFLCTCLAEEIEVDFPLAERIISEACKVVKSSPFTSQQSKAIKAIAALLKTQKYAEIAYKALAPMTKKDQLAAHKHRFEVMLSLYVSSTTSLTDKQQWISEVLEFARDPDLPIGQFITVARNLYQSSSSGSDQRKLATQLLFSLTQRTDLSIDQFISVARDLYQLSPSDSDERKHAMQLLFSLAQRDDLPIEQSISAARNLYQSSPSDSDEETLATQLLFSLAQRTDLLIEQSISVARTLYQSSPSDSDEEKFASQLLFSLAQRMDLPIEQFISAARDLYHLSPSDSDERKLATQLLFSLAQRDDLPIEQFISVARTLYQSSPSDSDEETLATQLLFSLAKRTDLPIEQFISVARTLYQSSPQSSDERKLATQLLSTLAQSADLPIDQFISAARDLYQSSPLDSDEEKFATQLLFTLAQRTDLPIEQSISAVRNLYQSSPSHSDEEKLAIHLLWKVVSDTQATISQKLQALTVFLAVGPINYINKTQAVRKLIQLLPPEQARQHLAKHWGDSILDTPEVSDIPYIAELAQQELLTPRARDVLYIKLSAMISHFSSDDIVWDVSNRPLF